MNQAQERLFYIDFRTIRMIYPRQVSTYVEDYGILEQYKDKKYTLKEINEIVADLVTKTPYINNSMDIKINIMSNRGYHHMLVIRNYDYDKQEREKDPRIKFLY